jgi:signal transduction histidine kinase/ActR/RegA family two-component response regulator
MVVPISARGRTLGAILLVSTRYERLYDADDLAMAEELGRRAGLAVDNARLYREVREADRVKDEFLAMLGHELRNPLSPIVTALELMNLQGVEAFVRERAIISRQVQQVIRLVDDLLDVSRITRGKIELQKQRVETAQVIAKAVEMASPILEERSQKLSLTAPPRGLPLAADPGRLAQAVANLLINAAKYTEAGSTIVLTTAVEGAEVAVRVKDPGMGIAPEMLSKIFDLFVQAKGALDRAQGGLGIGLTVVRNLVELHGGSVSAHSAGPGRGSEFVMRLPLADEPANPPRPVPPLADERPARVEPRRILIVDDNADAAQLLSEALEACGCTTRVAHDGPSALTVAERFKPEVALLDIGLPGMDGYELARQFQRMEATAATRLVAITGYGQPSDRKKSNDVGFHEHVVKPVGLDVLREILRHLPAQSGAGS